MWKIIAVVAGAAVVILLVVWALHSGYYSNSTTSNSSANPSVSSSAAATNSVNISGFAFSPGQITVKQGTTVTWTNQDTVTHTVTADNGLFDSGQLQAGKTYTFTFETAGTFAYHCNIHSSMHGTVVVTP